MALLCEIPEKNTDIDHLSEHYPLIFGVFTWIYLSVTSTAELCYHQEVTGQEHTLLSLPFLLLKGY